MIKSINILLLFALSFFPAEKGSMIENAKLRVEGIKSIQGNLGILVFNSASGFPSDAEKAILNLKVAVKSNTMEIDLGELPAGDYAFAILHDKNANKVMDKGLLGIPKEPFGFSNITEIPFGPPSFKQAKIILDDQHPMTTIQLLEI